MRGRRKKDSKSSKAPGASIKRESSLLCQECLPRFRIVYQNGFKDKSACAGSQIKAEEEALRVTTPGFSSPAFFPPSITHGSMVVISRIAGMPRNDIRRRSPKNHKRCWWHRRAVSHATVNMPSLTNTPKTPHLCWPWAYRSCHTLPTLSTNPFPKLITGSRYSIVLLSLGRDSIANTNNITASALL